MSMDDEQAKTTKLSVELEQLFQQALDLQQQGQLIQAERLLLQLTEASPNYFPAWLNLGVIQRHLGQVEAAIKSYQQALMLDNQQAGIWYNLGNIQRQLGNLGAAVKSFQQALEIKPEMIEALVNLAIVLKQQGNFIQAVQYLRQASQLAPDTPIIWQQLAFSYKALHDHVTAIPAYQRAIELNSDNVELMSDLAEIYFHNQNYQSSLNLFQNAVQLAPQQAKLHTALGVVHQQLGHYQLAEQSLNQAIDLDPRNAIIYSNLGALYQKQGKIEKALQALQQAIKLDSNCAMAHANIAYSYVQQGEIGAAIAACDATLALESNNTIAILNLGLAQVSRGQAQAAIKNFQRVLALEPDNNKAYSNCVYSKTYCHAYSAQETFQAHVEWGDYWQQRVTAITDYLVTNCKDRKPRIAYISPDFRQHPVGQLLKAFFAKHCKTFTVYCYANIKKPDALTRYFRQHAAQWYDINGLSYAEIADRIRNDQIDILIDLTGHTANNSLPVLAQKPAPIQMTYNGYPNTTGLATVDYIIADSYVIPAEQERLYREKVLRLPDCVFCYSPHDNAPDIAELVAPHHGYVTFGSFNNLPKVNAAVINLWARVLKRVPNSRLFLKSRPFADQATCDYFKQCFCEQGIAAERIELEGPSHVKDMLSRYAKIDIALDSFPFNGGLTSCDALWMGVPVITFAGENFCSRMGYSLLQNVGLIDFIAADKDHYVELAAQWAGDMHNLKQVRHDLRAKMRFSPLCDGAKFAESFEAVILEAWQRYQNGSK